MTEPKKEEGVFDGVGKQDIKRPANVKTISLGWGQEEMEASRQTKGSIPQTLKTKDSYCFVKHP